ncbi:hypothetical protein OIO03_24490, partial [Acinetobacter baumannii]|nr:hypothetical protein [Acinetobacter baumannii]MCW1766758.1 hypothetical protein [Acinetobacter baumannii]
RIDSGKSRAAAVSCARTLAASARQRATARPLHPNTGTVAPVWSDVAAVPAAEPPSGCRWPCDGERSRVHSSGAAPTRQAALIATVGPRPTPAHW